MCGVCLVWGGYSSSARKGFSIASIPSIGQIKTTCVPRHTERPKVRVSSDNRKGSSGSLQQSFMRVDSVGFLKI